MELISAYAPPTFSSPVLVYSTCDCPKSQPGNAHIMGTWIEAFNTGSALRIFYSEKTEQFLIADLPIEEAISRHLEMARMMENGGSNKRWEKGWPMYQEILRNYEEANFL